MPETITIDPETGEIMDDDTTAIEVHQPSNLFGASSPEKVVQRAVSVANELKAALKGQGLISMIHDKKTGRDREYPKVEAWTLLGSMLGVFPVVVWTKELDGGQGWEARVEARTINGDVVGAAEASCSRAERTWANRDDYAIRGMAQTRATSRALRGPLGFVMSLAGYEPVGIEEMPDQDVGGGSTGAGQVTLSEGPSRPAVQETTGPPPTPSKISDAQMRALHALGKRKGLEHSDLHDMAGRDFSVESTNDLTKQQTNELMKMLNELPDVPASGPVAAEDEGEGSPYG